MLQSRRTLSTIIHRHFIAEEKGTPMSNDESASRLKRPDLSLEENNYLLMLGDRIRDLRAQRGMTRKMLAQQSGVSERYLAQLETGHGNISIILLRQIAHGLGFP